MKGLVVGTVICEGVKQAYTQGQAKSNIKTLVSLTRSMNRLLAAL